MEEFSAQESFFFAVLALAMIAVSIALVFFTLFSMVPDPYTELYFELDSLGEKATAGEELPIAFFVENHEVQQADYNYSVLVDNANVKNGMFSLQDGEKKKVEENIQLSNPGENQKVEIKLNVLQDTYNIFFWIDVEEKQ